jgi:AcrR family transcriptional regulator
VTGAGPPQRRVTREDWLTAARRALVGDGIDRVKVAVLAEELGVARSSFYWYFTGREQLTDALLEEWALHNTVSIIERAERPADTITGALLTVCECWADRSLFDVQLEFAVREWARRDDRVRGRLVDADTRRIDALAALHRRFGYDRTEALVRARVQYHSQIGMYALGVDEPSAERLRLLPAYIRVFTGVDASRAELDRFARWVRSAEHAGR